MKLFIKLVLQLVLAILLANCGGSGNSGITLNISGTAAIGSAISGGSITFICSTGNATAFTNSDGTYQISIPSATAPCIAEVSDPNTSIKLHSVATSGSLVVNVNPLTELVTQSLFSASPSVVFNAANSTYFDQINASNVSVAISNVTAAVATLGARADISGINPINDPMVASYGSVTGGSADSKIDYLMATLSASGKSLSDLGQIISTSNNGSTSAQQVAALVGPAIYSPANCIYARSGNYSMIPISSSLVVRYTFDLNALTGTELSSGNNFSISPKIGSSGSAVPCSYTANYAGNNFDFMFSDDTMGLWVSNNSFGIMLPSQTNTVISDPRLSGTFAAFMYTTDVGSSIAVGSSDAKPYQVVFNQNQITTYGCDSLSVTPSCDLSTSIAEFNFNCTQNLNNSSSFSCTNSLGTESLTLYPYLSGKQISMFGTINKISPTNVVTNTGLFVLSKSLLESLPTVGITLPKSTTWSVGTFGSNVPAFILTSLTRQNATFNNLSIYEYQPSSDINISSSDTASRSYMASSFPGGKFYLNSPMNGMTRMIWADITGFWNYVSIDSPGGWTFSIQNYSQSNYFQIWDFNIFNRNFAN